MTARLCSDKGNVLSRITKVTIIASLIALCVLAFPISTTAKTKIKEATLVFTINPELAKPIVLVGPVRIIGPVKQTEVKATPKPKSKTKTKTASLPHANKVTVSVKQKVTGFDPCNCWSYVKYKRGGNMPLGYGNARNYPAPTKTPQIGSIIITYEGPRGHMGIIVGIDEKYVTIDDYNFKPCRGTVRQIPINSKLIKGYIL